MISNDNMSYHSENNSVNTGGFHPGTADSGATFSAAPVLIPKTASVPPSNSSENKTMFRFLSGRISTATTVFVGNISESCNDNLIRHLLQVVGRVINWRRVQGPNAKLESFGFVEYANQEDALRALRLVNGLHVGDKPLLTKVDEKTRINLDRYEQEQREYVKSCLKPGDMNETQTIAQSRQIEDKKIIDELKSLLQGHIVFTKFSYQDGSNSSDMVQPNSSVKIQPSENLLTKETNDHARRADTNKRNGNESTRVENQYRNRKNRSASQDDDAHEKRIIERRRQYKEDCYINRLKRWQHYEKNLFLEMEKRKSREQRRKVDQQEKKQRLFEFFDKYDDDKDDSKYYRGSSWQTKLLERESELDGDQRDMKREEQEEKTDRKTQQISSSELESDVSIHELPEIETQIPYSDIKENEHNIYGVNSQKIESNNFQENGVQKTYTEYKADSSHPIGFGIKPKPQPPPKTTTNTGLEEIFVPDDEEVIEQPPPKKIKLTVIDEKTKMSAPSIEYGPESAKYLTEKERKRKIRKLIEKIPADKSQLFSYDVKWFLVDNQLIDKTIKPWLKRRIVEYIGEEEPTLIEYLSKKILEKSSPDVLIRNISMILDEEAETFIIKLWRLLIYETEAKSQGLIQE